MNFESERELSPWSVQEQETSKTPFQEFLRTAVPPEQLRGPLSLPDVFFESSDRGLERSEGKKQERPAEVQIADILLKNDDFNYGEKRARAVGLFDEAMRRGLKDFTDLVRRTNAELRKRGSGLRIEVECEQQEKIKHIPPLPGETFHKSQLYRVTSNVGKLTVTNRFGETEDEAKVSVSVRSEPVGIMYADQVEKDEPENQQTPKKKFPRK